MTKSRRTSDLVNSLLVNADNSVNIHEGTQSPYFQLSTMATPTLQPGMFGWNDQYGTADLRLKGGNVTLQVGQENVVRVVNKTGADLLESQYKVVRVRLTSEGGAQGQRLAVVLAQGNNDPDSVTTLGIVTENIANNQEGFITVFGNINGVNTTGSLQGETWADGDVLYLSPTVAGKLTNIKPTAPDHTVTMGYVVYAHNNNGIIFVKVDNGYELEELHDVLPTPYVNNGVLYRDTTANVWKSATIATLLGGTPITSMPTLAQVTTAGNITTNSIEVGGLSLTGNRVILSSLSNSGRLELYNNIGTRDVDFLAGDFKSILYGNLAIGTNTNAGYKLDVNGTVRVVGAFRSQNSIDWYRSDSTYVLNYNNTANIIDINPAGSSSGPTFRVRNGINAYTLSILPNAKGVGIGVQTAVSPLHVGGSITASSALAQGVYFNNTLVAAANNDVLVGLDINPTFTNGAFTGVSNYALRVGTWFNLDHANTSLNIINTSIGGSRGMQVSQINDGVQAAVVQFLKARGTVAAQTNVNSGDIISAFTFRPRIAGAYTLDRSLFGANMATSTGIGMYFIAGSTDSNYAPSIYIHPTSNVVIGSAQSILSGITDTGYKLDVNGTARFISGLTTTPAITATGGNLADGVGISGSAYKYGVVGTSTSNTGAGVYGTAGATGGIGVLGNSTTYVNGVGVLGIGNNQGGSSAIKGQNGKWVLYLTHAQALESGGSIIYAESAYSLNTNPVMVLSTASSTADIVRLIGTGTQVFTVKSSGNTLIGTTTDSGHKLEVNGNIKLSSVAGQTATPSYIWLGNDYSNGTTRDKLKIYLYNSGTEQYGFSVGSSSDIQYHSNSKHDFYSANFLICRVNESGLTMSNGQTIGMGGETRYGMAKVWNASIGDMFGMEQVSSTQTGSYAATRIFTASVGSSYISLGKYTNTTSFTDWMKITSGGNVLINNTIDTGYRLDVNGNSRIKERLVIEGTTDFDNPLTLIANKTGNYGTIYLANTAATGQVLMILHNNVGGNYSYSSYGFMTYGGSSFGSPLFGVNRQNRLMIGVDGASNLGMYVGTLNAQPFVIGTNNLERMRVHSDGNVAIGTTINEGNKFEVFGGTSVFTKNATDDPATIRIHNNTNDQEAGIRMRSKGSSGTNMHVDIVVKATGGEDVGYLGFKVPYFNLPGQGVKMAIFNTGNVAIGTTVDTGYKLHVEGDINTTGAFRVNGVAGWTGTINIPTNPPGQQNLDIQGGIIVNVF